jgi:hypothetical protein
VPDARDSPRERSGGHGISEGVHFRRACRLERVERGRNKPGGMVSRCDGEGRYSIRAEEEYSSSFLSMGQCCSENRPRRRLESILSIFIKKYLVPSAQPKYDYSFGIIRR